MNLPHLKPILFAKKLISKEENSIKVLLEYDEIPTLPMILEGAAQASSGFESQQKNGFLLSCSNVALKLNATSKHLTVNIEKISNVANLYIFNFDVYDKLQPIASGELMLIIHD